MVVNIKKKMPKELKVSAGSYIGFAVMAILGLVLMVSQIAVLTYDILASEMFPAIRHLPAWCYFDQWSAFYRLSGAILVVPALFTVIYRVAHEVGLFERVIVIQRD